MSRYLKPRDHGYLMEAAACTKVLEDLRRIEAKYARTVEKECSVRQAEFEKVMQYHLSLIHILCGSFCGRQLVDDGSGK